MLRLVVQSNRATNCSKEWECFSVWIVPSFFLECLLIACKITFLLLPITNTDICDNFVPTEHVLFKLNFVLCLDGNRESFTSKAKVRLEFTLRKRILGVWVEFQPTQPTLDDTPNIMLHMQVFIVAVRNGRIRAARLRSMERCGKASLSTDADLFFFLFQRKGLSLVFIVILFLVKVNIIIKIDMHCTRRNQSIKVSISHQIINYWLLFYQLGRLALYT